MKSELAAARIAGGVRNEHSRTQTPVEIRVRVPGHCHFGTQMLAHSRGDLNQPVIRPSTKPVTIQFK
jgi:hypothetical protein